MRARHHRARRAYPQTAALRFKAAAAVAQGRRHAADGVECQDAVARISRGRLVAIALCDGAGSARLAARGASATADATVRHLVVHFDRLVADGHIRARVDIAERVYRTLRRVARRQGAPIEDLACTLLFAVTDGIQLLIGQLGDGRVAVRDAKTNEWRVLLTATKGEFANETTFVTSGRAEQDLRLVLGSAADVSACVLMSDGAEESLFDRAARTVAPAVETIAKWVASHTTIKVELALKQQLKSTLQTKTSDDLAIACISRNR